MIDLIFVANSQRIVRSDVIACSLSDHSLVFCVFKAGNTKAPPRIIEYRSYKHYNKQSFLQILNTSTGLPLYLLSFVETPRKFIIAELSIRKLGSSSVLIILPL